MLLTEVIKDPLKFKGDATLKLALKSQTGLAKYLNEEYEIASCSLNTLKNASEYLLPRGFVELDELRINTKIALESIELDKKTKTQTRAGLKDKVDELRTQLFALRKSHFLQSCIIEESRSELKKMAYSNQASEQAQRMYLEFNERLEEKLSYTLDGELYACIIFKKF
ncbi:MAG: hypothetical protein HRT73_08345 [Flavobacteriales bacterium]|nr:hypothetical protein [Flavobacteriales bacterium]